MATYPLQTKIVENVTNHGATGDGSSDDTAAIVLAIAAASTAGGVVYFPAGTYLITSALALETGVHFEGAGKDESVLLCGTTDVGAFANSGGTRIFAIRIENLSIKRTTGTTGGKALDLTDVDRSRFNNVAVTNNDSDTSALFADGFYIKADLGAYHNIFDGCSARVSQYAYHLTGDPITSQGANSTRIWGGEARADDSTAIYIESGNNVEIDGVSIEGDTVKGVHFVGDPLNVAQGSVIGCRFEHQGTPGTSIHFDSNGKNCLAIGNIFSSGIATKVDDDGEFNFWSDTNGGSTVSRGDHTLLRGQFKGTRASAESSLYTHWAGVQGDGHPRWFAKGSGRWGMGSGSASPDISFNRPSAYSIELEGGRWVLADRTFTDGDTTPSVQEGHFYKTANTAATTITNLDNGSEGQEIVIYFADANTTIVPSSPGTGSIVLHDGTTFTAASGETLRLINVGGNWVEQIRKARQFNTTDGPITAKRSDSGFEALGAGVTGDSFNRFSVNGAGWARWGSGSATWDVVMDRTATASLALRSGKWICPVRAVTDGATSVDVSNGNLFQFANTGSTTVTTFTGGQSGQTITLILDANTTIQASSALRLAGGVNFVGTASDTLTLVLVSGVWYERSRSLNA